jgi:hypothetical protein
MSLPCNPDAHGKSLNPKSTPAITPGAFSVAFGNPANAGYLYGLTMFVDLHVQAARNASEDAISHPQDSDSRLVEVLGTRTEPWSARVKDALHVHVETLTPLQFLEGVESFLDSVGVNDFAEISINEQSVQLDSGELGLHEVVFLCKARLQKELSSVRTMEISSTGRNDAFSLLLDFFYSRRHRYDQAPISLEIRAIANELGPKEGELFSDYRARMNAVDTDVHRRTRIYDAIEAEKKTLFADFAHHLEETFPGVRLRVYESASPAV